MTKFLMISSMKLYTSVFLVFVLLVILRKTSSIQTLAKLFVLLDMPNNKVLDKTSSYCKGQHGFEDKPTYFTVDPWSLSLFLILREDFLLDKQNKCLLNLHNPWPFYNFRKYHWAYNFSINLGMI